MSMTRVRPGETEPANPPPGAAAPGWPTPRRLARWLPLLTVLVAVIAVLVDLGTAPWDIVRYSAYVAWGVLLPGVLVYRALRQTPHSLADDLAMGAALGLVLEIGAYVLASVTGLHALLWLWPLLVVVPFAAVPRLRRHWRPAGYQAAPLLWSWAVAAVCLWMLGYLTFAFLRPNPPVPTARPHLYFIDQLYLLSLVGDAKHHFPLQTPSVAGEPLPYHWFAFAHMAVASTVSGVDTTVVFFRFFLPSICLLAVVLLAVVGWRVSGRPAVGAVATVLNFAVGELVVGSYAGGPFGGAVAYSVWSSESVPYGWVMTIPLIALALDRLTGGLPGAPVGRRAWPLLVLFALAGPGSKATVVPVMLCAVGLVALVELARRRPSGAAWKILGILVAAQLFGMAVLYGFQSQGIGLKPFGIFYVQFNGWHDKPVWKLVATYVVLLVGYGIYMLTRFLGIPVLAWIRRKSWGTTEWFLLGGATGGTLGTLLLWHPSLSQNYFVRAGFAFGAILSAMGLVALVDRHRVPARVLAVIVAAVPAVAFVLFVVLWRAGAGVGGRTYRDMLPVYRMALAVAAVAVVVAAALSLARRRWPRLRGVASVAILALALGAGLPSMAWDAHKYPNANNYYHTLVSPDQAAAARWLRSHSDPAELVATNVHCVSAPPNDCWHLSFWLSAFAERRFLVESWGYTAKTNAAAAVTERSPADLPFWDPDLLARNDAAFYAPDAGRITWLRERGVGWMIVDRRYGLGQESPALSKLTDLTWERGPIAIYRVPRLGA